MFRTKPLIVLVLIIVVLALGVVSFLTRYSKEAPSQEYPAAQNPPAPQEQTQTSAAAPTPPAPKSPAPAPQTSKSVSLVSPTVSEKWVIGETNTISWNKESGLPGSIYLVKASDKSVTGWINSETGAHQTSFAWNGQDVAVSRYGSQKKNVEHGDYIIKIKFDRSQIPEASSGVFSLIYKSEAPIGEYTVPIKNYVFSPSMLNVRQKDNITFINNDSVTHRIIVGSYSPFVVEPGASYTFDTSSLFPGIYDFYSDVYSSLKLKVTVR